jgi:transposase
MKLYAGIGLHANNNYLAVIDENDTRVYRRKLPNKPDVILAELEPFKKNITGIVVESTFNWYWLVDLLMEAGYSLHLANPAAIQKYKGLKHSDDKHDAFWLAHMLRLNILPEGYIYPKEDRPVRDLLRKRGHLVQIRTALINSLQGIISRNCGCSLNANKIKAVKEDHITPLLSGQEDLELSGTVSKDCIDFLTRKIRDIELVIKGKIKLRPSFISLRTIPGVGLTLALTIMLETGEISRFSKVGQYSSYCRKVPSKWTSNNKKKGKGNVKNGNRYLAWAFSEAAEFSKRYNDSAKAFFNKKSAKTNRTVAHAALVYKLTRVSYYIMRDGVEFDSNKLFS